MDLLVYDDEDRRYVPALVALCGALLVALALAALAFFLGRGQSVEQVGSGQVSGVTPPQAALVEQSDCGPALERADAAVALGDELERSLAEQTALVDDLLARRATAGQVLDEALPQLAAGAKDRQAFLDAVSAYEQAKADCQQ